MTAKVRILKSLTPPTATELAMDETNPQSVPTPEAQRDLRAEMLQSLAAEFAAALESNGSLPAATQEALVALLDSDVPNAAKIVESASINGPGED